VRILATPEGDSGTTPLPFTVSLDRASTMKVTIHWATQDSTAVAGSDYQAASGVLTFEPGSDQPDGHGARER
jgi:hypothetical protein